MKGKESRAGIKVRFKGIMADFKEKYAKVNNLEEYNSVFKECLSALKKMKQENEKVYNELSDYGVLLRDASWTAHGRVTGRPTPRI